MKTNQHRGQKITFANPLQVALFEQELSGQISDGYWENSRPFDHWEMMCRAKIVWSKNLDEYGVNFYPARSYNFAAKELLDAVGDRMLDICNSYAWTAAKFGTEHELYKMFMEEASGMGYCSISDAANLFERSLDARLNQLSQLREEYEIIVSLGHDATKTSTYLENQIKDLEKQYNAQVKYVQLGLTLELIKEWSNYLDSAPYSEKDLRKELRHMSKIVNSGRK